MICGLDLGGGMTQNKLNYIHYYLLVIVASILIWGGFEYISICNGHNCMIDTTRLWKGLNIITLIFIPITLCIWSDYVNGQIKKLFAIFRLQYEEKTLIFAIAIFVTLGIASLLIFNGWWEYYVDDAKIEEKKTFTKYGKEYMSALVNLSVFVATLFAPIAALILYDNWKIQKNYDLNKEILLSIDNIIFDIYNDIFKRINCITSLYEIDSYKISIENYPENKNLSNYVNEINQLQSKIELYDALNKKNLKEHFNNFGGSIFRITHISQNIFDVYDDYASKIKIENSKNTVSVKYTNSEKIMYKNEIDNLKKALLKKHRYQSSDLSEMIFLDFIDALDDFKNQYQTITNEVRKNIKA